MNVNLAAAGDLGLLITGGVLLYLKGFRKLGHLAMLTLVAVIILFVLKLS
jgi:hypothetical protein